MSRRTFQKSLTALIGGLALPAVARAATSRNNARAPLKIHISSFRRKPESSIFKRLDTGPRITVRGRLRRCGEFLEVPAKSLQHSPLAGFQYHNGETLWPHRAVRPELVEGPLQLVREPENRFDDRAVRVDWQGHKLGYIPRLDNAAVSQLLDRGERLEAMIARLAESGNPWNRIKVEVRWRV